MRASYIYTLLLLASLTAFSNDEVCLTVDTNNTEHPKHPNQARVVNDRNSLFYVYPGQKACFDLTKTYYMQYFFWEDKNARVYATKCLYTPDAAHEGKVLLYEGNSSQTPCPIKDRVAND